MVSSDGRAIRCNDRTTGEMATDILAAADALSRPVPAGNAEMREAVARTLYETDERSSTIVRMNANWEDLATHHHAKYYRYADAILALRLDGRGEAIEECARVADARATYCADTMELPGQRHDDKMTWEQRRNEARGIATAIRELAPGEGA
jgi:collagenase-like PrtC family protease